tara:strand:+ start:135 stop:536 length:402 start_codon:yes stop_codon:yes gene_type:complete
MEWNDETNNEQNETVFLPYRESMKVDGEFKFTFTNVSHNDAAGKDHSSECITLFDDEDRAVTVWCKSHANSLYPLPDEKTDGAKLARALKRAFGGSNWDEVFELASAGGSLSVTKNDFEASPTGFAWLWQVTA